MIPKSMIRAATVTVIAAVTGGVLVASIFLLTREPIRENQQAVLLRSLNTVMPSEHYDNDLHHDIYAATHMTLLGSEEPLPIYRARQNGIPTGAVITAIAPNGYNGAIRLLVGVDATGKILAVRVVEHQETPGLGDKIEKRKSDWVDDFEGHALVDTSEQQWQVKRDGGVFDQFSGATITPRAVVSAVQKALRFYQQKKAVIFADDNHS